MGIRRIATVGAHQFVVESRSSNFSEYQIFNISYRVGDLWFQDSSTSTPPGQGLPITGVNDVVTWEEVTDSQGAVLIGASGSGSWAGVSGSVGGNADSLIGQSTDPMALTNLIPHRHTVRESTNGTGGTGPEAQSLVNDTNTGFTPPQTQTPVGIPLSNLRRYLVGVWRRTV